MNNPTLQRKILALLATEENALSKSSSILTAEHSYSNVSDAFDKLKEKKWVKASKIVPGRGRPEIFYKITEEGLQSFIGNCGPKEFWLAMKMFCHRSNEYDQVTLAKKFNEYFHLFERSYIGHSSSNQSYLPQSDFFDKLLTKWLSDNNVFKSLAPGPPQIVIECLAINRGITFQQLVEKTGLSEKEISYILESYTMKPDYSTVYYVGEEDYFDVDRLTDEYMDFIQRLLIIASTKKGGTGITTTTYELSLLGVMLTLSIVRYSQMDDYDVVRYFNLDGNAHRPKLFYNNFTIAEYYSSVALNYKDKLPLVFGKWPSLKKTFGSRLVYCFDPVLDEKARRNRMATPVRLGGNKEFYDNMRALSEYRRAKLIEIYEQGRIALYGSGSSEVDIEETAPILRKLDQIAAILRYSNLKSFIDTLQEVETSLLRLRSEPRTNTLYNEEARVIEQMFTDEITYLCYLNLCRDDFPFLMPPYADQVLSQLSTHLERVRNADLKRLDQTISTKRSLIEFLQDHPDIKERFSTWLQETIHYQKETLEAMSNFYNVEVQGEKRQ